MYTESIMEYTADDADDIIACLQSISEWWSVRFSGITRYRDELIIQTKPVNKVNGFDEANKYLQEILEYKTINRLRIIYDGAIHNAVIITVI